MKKTSIEENLLRIHELTYGKKFLNENKEEMIKKLFDLIGFKDIKLPNIDLGQTEKSTNSLDKFYEILDDAIKNGGISNSDENTEEGKKKIESLQIGLKLLGYDIKNDDITGKYNDKTKNAIDKFMEDNSIKLNKENFSKIYEKILNEISLISFKDASYNNLKFARKVLNDKINKSLLDDLNKAAEIAGIIVTVTTAKTGHKTKTITGNVSRHSKQTAVDIGILNGVAAKGATNANNGNPEFRNLGTKLKNALVSLGYTWNQERGNEKAVLWQTNIGGNHYNHLHVSNNGGTSNANPSKEKTNSDTELDTKKSVNLLVGAEVLDKLVDLLKSKNISIDDLKIDGDTQEKNNITSDDDFYKSILKCVGAPESEENMKFMYAWRQSEGGKYRNNPFNTKRDYPDAEGSGIKNYKTPQDGVNATCETLKLSYYTCIVDGLKKDIGALKISQKCDSALSTWGTHATNPLITQVLQGYEKGYDIKADPIA